MVQRMEGHGTYVPIATRRLGTLVGRQVTVVHVMCQNGYIYVIPVGVLSETVRF